MIWRFINSAGLAVLLGMLFTQTALAASKETIYATYKYVLGDSDTKSDAKKIAFIEAKRLCLEKAGVYLESTAEVLNSQLAKDEIKTYTSGILKVEIISEQFKAVDETLTLFMEVKAVVDVKEVNENLKRFKSDKKYASKIKEQEKQLQNLEQKIRNLQNQLESADSDKVIILRKERNTTFKRISEVEKIMFSMKMSARKAVDNVERGMTPSEVIKVAGKPRAKGINDDHWNYGEVWVIIENSIVGCIVDGKAYNKAWVDACEVYGKQGAVIK